MERNWGFNSRETKVCNTNWICTTPFRIRDKLQTVGVIALTLEACSRCWCVMTPTQITVREAALFREQYHLVDLRQKKLHRNGIERLREACIEHVREIRYNKAAAHCASSSMPLQFVLLRCKAQDPQDMNSSYTSLGIR